MYNGIRIVDLKTGKEALFSERPSRARTALAFAPDGQTLAVAGREEITLLDPATGTLLHRFTGHRGLIHCLAFSPDASLLFSAAADSTVLAWDLRFLKK